MITKLKLHQARYLFLALMLLGSSLAFSQQRTVSGEVKNSGDGLPVPGATVTIKGTKKAVVSDARGSFSISVPDDNAVLIISSIGYNSLEIPVKGRATIMVQLVQRSSSLEEIIVTGYSTERKKDITGAISSVKGDDIVSIPSSSIAQQLQGKISGVTITTSGVPGDAGRILIRGIGSFNTNNPLVIIDGVPGSLSDINANDIENVSVLKDASAASIYGAQAFAGVILVTTKKGRSGKLTVYHNASYGIQYPGKGYGILSPQEIADWTWTAMKNGGVTPIHPQYGTGANPVLPDYILAGNNYGLMTGDPRINFDAYNIDPALGPVYQIVKGNKAGTDWYKEITRTAPLTDNSLSLSGGNENARYNVGLGYTNQQGVVLNSFFKRYTLRANTEFNIKSRVKIGENIQLMLRENPGFRNQYEGNALAMSYRENPFIPVHDINGGWAGTAAHGFNNPSNPVADLYRARNDWSRDFGVFGSVFAEVKLPYSLTFRSNFGGNYGTYYYASYTQRSYENFENSGTNGMYEGSGYNYDWVWTNTLSFNRAFDKHNVKALIGTEALSGQGRNIDGSGVNPFSLDPNYLMLNTTEGGSSRQVSDGGGPYDNIYSIFGQVNYSYADKYLFSGTIRRDGAAVFGPNFKYGVFPAASVGWRISGEPFMKNLNWVNDLKIRGSYGEMGNSNPVPLTNQYSTYAPNIRIASYDLNGTSNSLVEGFRAASIGEPNAHWETNKTIDVGFDATLWGNLNIVVDWYKRTTEGLLFAVRLPATFGWPDRFPVINVGSMKNTGIDLQIDKRGNINKDWRYVAGLRFTSYKNTIVKIADGIDYFDDEGSGSSRLNSPMTRNMVGHPVSAFFGYKVVGLWQSQSEIDAANAGAQRALGDPAATFQDGDSRPGEFKYLDVNKDGYISADDRTFIGNPNPDFNYGLNFSVGYKNWDLNFEFYGVQGADIFNYTKWYTDFYNSFPGAAIGTRVRDSWTPQHTNTNIPIFTTRNVLGTNSVVNSYYVEDGSYLRCRNIQLSYTFGAGKLAKVGIENLRIYAQAVNPFTVTKYTGLDPAVGGGGITNFGGDYGNYPMVKQVIFGIHLNF